MNGYLIPANSKKGTLIFNLFREKDLIILGVGIISTMLILMFVNNANIWHVVAAVMPALISILLVLPLPYYHNVLCAIQSIINFYTKRRKYIWKGWCFYERISKDK